MSVDGNYRCQSASLPGKNRVCIAKTLLQHQNPLDVSFNTPNHVIHITQVALMFIQLLQVFLKKEQYDVTSTNYYACLIGSLDTSLLLCYTVGH